MTSGNQEKREVRTKTAQKKNRKRKKKRGRVTAEAVKTVRDTLAKIDSSKTRSKKKKKRRYREEKAERQQQVETGRETVTRKIRVTDYTSPSELADLMGVSLNSIIGKFLEQGVMATANQRLDVETVTLIAGLGGMIGVLFS